MHVPITNYPASIDLLWMVLFQFHTKHHKSSSLQGNGRCFPCQTHTQTNYNMRQKYIF